MQVLILGTLSLVGLLLTLVLLAALTGAMQGERVHASAEARPGRSSQNLLAALEREAARRRARS
jgi:hypothetical protein